MGYKMGKKKESHDRKIRPWMEYKLHIVVFVLVVIAELIGVKKLNITGTVSIVLMPLLYAMIMGLALFLAKPVKFIQNHESKIAEGLMILFMVPIIVKLALSSGQVFESLSFAPALILQQIGNLGTIFFAMPVALLLGFKRESIGMTSSICREPNIGIILDKYGIRSPETRCFHKSCGKPFHCSSPSPLCSCNGKRYRKRKYECGGYCAIAKYFPFNVT